MSTDTPATTPTITSPFSSLLATIDPYADDHPLTALDTLLRRIHSSLEVLHFYASHTLTTDPNPIDIHISEALGSAVSMAARACEDIDNLASRLNSAWTQSKTIVAQYDKEVLS